ncbi:glycosyltransferase family 2 protein [Cellulomonas oligotrophica]|uniref:Glycosyl transferase n=1 Tax=Cellulomonas oligotrophica TaxID=931536 RepID=A0A7Y9JX33_9CELL|nr:glycosyltransferase family 2 protein [Cellulomonas oligotrophica]NYD85232.1 glycosyltransferase involved in cell wall biosynthesis [Cellulomonas oligotrophica]GIG33332.1 glycosyl transferase [Cellulomonas oligotrophica]
MKVFVQVPCLNEEETLPAVLASIPRSIEGVDELEILVIDDGSTDRTVEVARALGVRHFVRHARNMGLARSFRDGVDYALAHGADIVVNTDGDNQYPQDRIPDLVAPIIAGRADIVIADRQTQTIAHFSPFKKFMQKVGSAVVNGAADTDLPDAASGFRAYSRSSLLRLNIVTEFSYCMETIIQAGHKRLRIESVPVETNAKTRESRLFRNIFHHMAKSGSAIVRSYLMFKPQAVFTVLTVTFAVVAAIPFVRFLVIWLSGGDTNGNVQSLIFGSIMAVAALLALALGVLSDLQRTNRILLEDQLERIKAVQYRDAFTAGGPIEGRSGAPAQNAPARADVTAG